MLNWIKTKPWFFGLIIVIIAFVLRLIAALKFIKLC